MKSKIQQCLFSPFKRVLCTQVINNKRLCQSRNLRQVGTYALGYLGSGYLDTPLDFLKFPSRYLRRYITNFPYNFVGIKIYLNVFAMYSYEYLSKPKNVLVLVLVLTLIHSQVGTSVFCFSLAPNVHDSKRSRNYGNRYLLSKMYLVTWYLIHT